MKHVNVALFLPFAGCVHRCAFCNQHTITGQSAMLKPEDVTAAIETAKQSGSLTRDSELAFFGGCFTALQEETMSSLLAAAQPYLRDGTIKGIRLSTRPDCIDDNVLTLLKASGVTAIELGVQSMDDNVLKLNQRGHTAADTEKACKRIRRYGFELGVQMMTGLPGDSDEGALETAEKLIALLPDTVRIYPTLVLENTMLADWLKEGQYRAQTLDEAVTLCAKLMCLFHKAGVRIIRVGLHASDNIAANRLAGAYHPAFRELCESELYLNQAISLLQPKPKGSYTITVGARWLSQAVGHNKRNLNKLASLGYTVQFLPDETLGQYEMKL